MKTTAIQLSHYEFICSMDGFGYKTPTSEDLESIIRGLVAIKKYVGALTVPPDYTQSNNRQIVTAS